MSNRQRVPGLQVQSFVSAAPFFYSPGMALMLPGTFPHDLTKKPKLKGEADVYCALRAALDVEWTVFYDQPIPGSRRRVDFLAANPRRGLLAVEVKGGMVHDKRGTFRQLVSKSGQRKKIDPFGQLKRAVGDLLTAAGVEVAVPMHQAIWLPDMGQGGLRWQPSDHILTREHLSPSQVAGLMVRVLPPLDDMQLRSAVERVMKVLLPVK